MLDAIQKRDREEGAGLYKVSHQIKHEIVGIQTRAISYCMFGSTRERKKVASICVMPPPACGTYHPGF
jgi:hypothetical protein